ncbi:MAG: hypothetical protein GXP51_10745 [Deltaproteobacteria bacterium]|nr:hypothetical protein [Deltaproteobacteria bacterium]
MTVKKRNEFVISFRVNNEEKSVLLEMANKSGVNISQLMRMKLDLLDNRMLENQPSAEL